MSLHRIALLAPTLVLTLAACGITLRPHAKVGEDRPLSPGINVATDTKIDRRLDGGVIQVCRATGIKQGFVAVDYVADSKCPRLIGGDSEYNAALVLRYDRLPAASELTVCNDQVIPSGWQRVRTPEGDYSCPKTGLAAPGNTVVIRKRS